MLGCPAPGERTGRLEVILVLPRVTFGQVTLLLWAFVFSFVKWRLQCYLTGVLVSPELADFTCQARIILALLLLLWFGFLFWTVFNVECEFKRKNAIYWKFGCNLEVGQF